MGRVREVEPELRSKNGVTFLRLWLRRSQALSRNGTTSTASNAATNAHGGDVTKEYHPGKAHHLDLRALQRH